MSTYDEGMYALGLEVGDILNMIPAVSAVSSLTGKKPSGTTTTPVPDAQEAIKKAIAEERARQAKEKAEAEDKRNKLILYIALGTVGVVALGGATILLLRK